MYLFAPGISVTHLHLLSYLQDCVRLRVFCCKLDKCCPVNESIATVAPGCAVDLALLRISKDDLEAFLGTSYHAVSRILQLAPGSEPSGIPEDEFVSRLKAQCGTDTFILKSLSPTFAIWSTIALLLFQHPSGEAGQDYQASYLNEARIETLRCIRSFNVVWRTLTARQACRIVNDHLPWSASLATKNWNSICQKLV